MYICTRSSIISDSVLGENAGTFRAGLALGIDTVGVSAVGEYVVADRPADPARTTSTSSIERFQVLILKRAQPLLARRLLAASSAIALTDVQ